MTCRNGGHTLDIQSEQLHYGKREEMNRASRRLLTVVALLILCMQGAGLARAVDSLGTTQLMPAASGSTHDPSHTRLPWAAPHRYQANPGRGHRTPTFTLSPHRHAEIHQHVGLASHTTVGCNADENLTSVGNWLGNTTSYAYDADGNPTTQTYPNGVVASSGYDHADQLTDFADTEGATTLWSSGYTRDPLGRLATLTDTLPDGSSAQHQYTMQGFGGLGSDQILQGGNWTTQTSWSYTTPDEIGQITSPLAGLTSTLTYDDAHALTRLETSNGTSDTQNSTYGFNADGDRTSQSDSVSGVSATVGYDQADELTSYQSGSTSAGYGYDGSGLRMSKTVNGSAEGFTWDEAEGLPLLLQDGSTRYVTGLGGLPLEQVGGDGSVLYYHQDQLGSTRLLSDEAGAVQGQYAYDPFGTVQVHTGTSTPFQYAGQYTDSESGLQYLQARYYDPSTMQFLTVDPLVGLTGEPYGYTGNTPLNTADPSGMCSYFVVCWNPVRVSLIWGFSTAGNWIGDEYSELTSGNPLCVGLAAGSIYLSVLTFGEGAAADASLEGLESLEPGQQFLYRVWGDDSKLYGHSWTTEDPRSLLNARDELGLPLRNSGKYVTRARVTSDNGFVRRAALPLYGNAGGAPEVLVPEPRSQLRIERTWRQMPPL